MPDASHHDRSQAGARPGTALRRIGGQDARGESAASTAYPSAVGFYLDSEVNGGPGQHLEMRFTWSGHHIRPLERGCADLHRRYQDGCHQIDAGAPLRIAQQDEAEMAAAVGTAP